MMNPISFSSNKEGFQQEMEKQYRNWVETKNISKKSDITQEKYGKEEKEESKEKGEKKTLNPIQLVTPCMVFKLFWGKK